MLTLCTNSIAYVFHRRTFAKGIDDLYQADLCDVSSISEFNDGYKFILTVIDVVSKRAWAFPLKSKTGVSIRDAFLTSIENPQTKFLTNR